MMANPGRIETAPTRRVATSANLATAGETVSVNLATDSIGGALAGVRVAHAYARASTHFPIAPQYPVVLTILRVDL